MSHKQLSAVAAVVLGLAAALGWAGQLGAAPSGTASGQARGNTVPFETLDQGPRGPWVEAGIWIFTSPEAWDSTMAAMEADGTIDIAPPPAAPDNIDWNHDAVVLVSFGQVNGSGYGICVCGVSRAGRICVVDVQKSGPPNRWWAGGIDRPYHIVRVDRRGLDSVQYGAIQWIITGPPPATALSAGDGGIAGEAPGSRVQRTTWGALKSLEY